MDAYILLAGLALAAITGLGGLIVWLVKGRIDRADQDLARLKESVVYEDTCTERHKRSDDALTHVAQGQTEIKDMQSKTFDAVNVLNTEVASIKGGMIGMQTAFKAALEANKPKED